MDNVAVAQRISDCAKNKGVSVRRMLIELGINPAYVAQMRSAKTPPTKLPDIAAYLGVSVDYLLGAESPTEEQVDERYVRLVNAVRGLSPEEVDAWLALLERRAGQ